MYTAGLSATLAFPYPFWFSAVWGSFILEYESEQNYILYDAVLPIFPQYFIIEKFGR